MFRYLKTHKLVLGETYGIQYMGYRPVKAKFIKVTRKGYNFLNDKTSCCIMKQHLYVPKKHKDECFNDLVVVGTIQDWTICE